MKKIYFPLLFLTTTFTAYAQEKIEPTYNAASLEEQALAYKNNNEIEKAIAEYAKVDELDPVYFEAQYQRILLYLTLDKKAEAEALCKQLIDQYGKEIPENYFLSYGIFQSEQGKYAEALTYFAKAKKEHSLNVLATFNEALVYYKEGKKQQALDLLKEVITLAPNYGQAYYILGLIAIEDGQTAIGLLSLLSYLAIHPDTDAAKESLYHLNRNLADIYTVTPQLVYGNEGDDFSELDIILKNNLAQHKDYPLKVELNHRVTRVIQAILEYMNEHEVEGGFFESHYTPWMKEIVQRDLLSPFTYLAMITQEDSYPKLFKKQTTAIRNYVQNDLQTHIYPLLYQATVEGKTYTVTDTNNGFFYYQGDLDHLNGAAFQVSKNYHKESEGTFLDHQLSGMLKRYTQRGKLLSTEPYTADKIAGTKTTFYKTGKVFLEENIKEENYDGRTTVYHIAQTKKGTLDYKAGEIDGEVSYFFPTGELEYQYTTVDGKKEGEIAIYDENGTLISKYTYKDGLLEGLGVTYFPNGTLKSEALFKGDEYVYYKEFFDHGVLSYYYQYENGQLKTSDSYNIKGEHVDQYMYDADGELETAISYEKGQIYLVEKYKKDKLTERQTYNPKTQQLEVLPKNGTVQYYFPTGQLYGEGKLVNGLQEGLWTYYYPHGPKFNETNYANGKAIGEVKKYTKTGQLDEVYTLEEGQMSGLYRYYRGDQLVYMNYYTAGEQAGPSTSFYNYPIPEIKRFYVDNALDHKEVYYTKTGLPYRVNHYDEGTLYQVDFSQGKEMHSLHLDQFATKGTFTSTLFNTKTTYTLEGGTFNGPVKRTDLSSAILLDTYAMRNNKLHGTYISYYPNGVVNDSSTLILDKRYGSNEHLNPDGKVRVTASFIRNSNHGGRQLYYPEGKVAIHTNYIMDYTDGEEIYSNSQGTPLLALVYDLDVLVGYRKLSATEELSDILPISATDTVVQSHYKSGQLAAEVHLKHYFLDGALTLYNPTGKEAYRLGYAQGKKHGAEQIYYSNGSLYSSVPYNFQSTTGVKTIYASTGEKLFEQTFDKGELHGDFNLYEANTLKQSYFYDSDFLSNKK